MKLGIFLIILLLLFWLWPYIIRWIQRQMALRAEKIMRRMAGMPPPPGSREEKKTRRNSRRERHTSNNPAPITEMRAVAEDAEYTEIKEYSEETIIDGEGRRRERRVYREEQVSDAEYVMVKGEKTSDK